MLVFFLAQSILFSNSFGERFKVSYDVSSNRQVEITGKVDRKGIPSDPSIILGHQKHPVDMLAYYAPLINNKKYDHSKWVVGVRQIFSKEFERNLLSHSKGLRGNGKTHYWNQYFFVYNGGVLMVFEKNDQWEMSVTIGVHHCTRAQVLEIVGLAKSVQVERTAIAVFTKTFYEILKI